jgi:hypothetical protein
MKLKLYLIGETHLARHYAIPRIDPEKPENQGKAIIYKKIWIPRSVIKSQTKYPRTPFPICIVEVDDWFAKKEGLDEQV